MPRSRLPRDPKPTISLFLYESKFEEMLQKHRNLSEGQLQRMIDLAYRGWLRAQLKPTSIPPKA